MGLINRLLTRTQFEYENNLSKDLSSIPLYKRYYSNPKNIKVSFLKNEGKKIKFNFTKYNDQLEMILEKILEVVYKDSSNINSHIIETLDSILKENINT